MTTLFVGLLALSSVSAFAEPKYQNCVIARTNINRPCFHAIANHVRDVEVQITLFGDKISESANQMRTIYEKSIVTSLEKADGYDFETPARKSVEKARRIAAKACTTVKENL